MPSIDIPAYLRWRDGRPRWDPGPRLRPHFRGVDLKDAAGAWLTFEEACAAARALNAEVIAWKNGGRIRRVAVPPPRRSVRTCALLWDEVTASPKHARRRASTRADYERKARVFLDRFGDAPVASIGKHHLYKWWQELFHARGHAMANGVLAVVRLSFSHAARIGWRVDNPAAALGLEGVPPRIVTYTSAEVSALVEAGDAVGHPEVTDAVIVALHTGQRQGDVLRLEEGAIEGGRVAFRIGKTGARVRVPVTPQLAARLADIRARRAGTVVTDLALARRVVLWQGRPYSASQFGKHWRRVRAAAAERLPGIADKLFMDLRDTAITRLALAGCTVTEVRAITGHTLETIHTVLRHYVALDDRMADAAIGKLRAYLEEEGIAV